MRVVNAVVLISLFSIATWAQIDTPPEETPAAPQTLDAATTNDDLGSAAPSPAPQAQPPSTTYSHGFAVRRRIHRVASYTTLPLFATELAIGQSLFDNPGGSKRGAHE